MSLSEYLKKRQQPQAGDIATDTGANSATSSEAEKVPAPPATVEQTGEKPSEPGLLLRLWNRKVWAFPWSYFMEAEYYPAIPNDVTMQSQDMTTSSFAEQIRLVLGSREIAMRGRNLAVLMEAIVRHRVLELHEVPEKLSAANTHDTTDPIIVSMEIRVRPK